MSASSKKKLRNAQEADKLTEKQRAQQKETKQLKTYTVIFVVVLALMIAFTAYTLINRSITKNGVRERNTVALTVNGHDISNAELNMFYMDVVNNFYSYYGSYATYVGLDLTSPLDEQVTDEETGETWADYFLDSAISSAKSVYALCDEAEAQGYTLPEEGEESVESQMTTLQTYATAYGYSSLKDYLKAYYGNGATEENVREYYEKCYLATYYQSYYEESLTYDDEAIAAEDEANGVQYSYYSYNYYYVKASAYREGGTTDEDGNTTYSDEEEAAAVEAAKEAAEALADGEYADTDEFDEAIAAMPINADSEDEVTSTGYEDRAYSSVTSAFRDWVTDSSREVGDITCIENSSTVTDEDGNETETILGYYVVMFEGVNDNSMNLVNVRHILVSFEGGTTDDDGNTTYSDEEKAEAKEKAEELLQTWKDGDATEESFAALATENTSDTASQDNGGLYENVYPGEMVDNFNDWCFDESREAGDTGIVESDYGYHIMYFSGYCDITYREYLIKSTLASNDADEWYDALIENATVTEKNFQYIATDLVLSSS